MENTFEFLQCLLGIVDDVVQSNGAVLTNADYMTSFGIYILPSVDKGLTVQSLQLPTRLIRGASSDCPRVVIFRINNDILLDVDNFVYQNIDSILPAS